MDSSHLFVQALDIIFIHANNENIQEKYRSGLIQFHISMVIPILGVSDSIGIYQNTVPLEPNPRPRTKEHLPNQSNSTAPA